MELTLRGRKPLPTQQLEQRGSWRAKTRRNEPELAISAPEPPDWLEPDARRHWTLLSEMLVNARIMAHAHGPALVLLVNALGRYIQAEKDVNEHGAWFGGEGEIPRVHPAWTVRCKAWEQVQKQLVEFGMTPSALSRVHPIGVKESKPSDGKFKPKLVG